jgi:hypothetical protein
MSETTDRPGDVPAATTTKRGSGRRPRPDLGAEPRPPVAPASLVGTVAGLFMALALITFLSEVSGDNVRLAGLALSLAFEVLGVALMVLASGRRPASAGVALTAIGVVPLLVYLFVDVENPSNTFERASDFTTTATLVLLAAAALWLVAHLYGPGRRHALYLGAALVAVWLAVVVQIVREPVQDVESVFGPGEPVVFEGTFDGSGETLNVDSEAFDERMRQFDLMNAGEVVCEDGELVQGDPSFWECSQGDFPVLTDEAVNSSIGSTGSLQGEDFPRPSDPTTKIAWTTLAFGAAYLALAGRLDRRGDHRRATAFFAVATPLLYLAVITLGAPLNLWLQTGLALVLAVAAVRLATRTDRRFTAWAATLGAFLATTALVVDQFDDTNLALGGVFLALGVLVAVAAFALEGGLGPFGGRTPLGPAPVDDGPPTVEAEAPASVSAATLPSAPVDPTTAEATTPASVPAGLPTFEPPEPSPWAPPAAPETGPSKLRLPTADVDKGVPQP